MQATQLPPNLHTIIRALAKNEAAFMAAATAAGFAEPLEDLTERVPEASSSCVVVGP